MKLFLINPDYLLYGDPPLGLACLAAYVLKKCKDVDVKILDQLSQNEILKKIREENPQFIGLGATTGNYKVVNELGRKLKKISPNSILILGGNHVTLCPESFNSSAFDVAIRGEGEISLAEFLNSMQKNNKINIKELKKLPGFLLREKNKIINTGLSRQVENLDDLPMPARNLLNMTYYSIPSFSPKRMDACGALITSRGCPFSCSFCSTSAFWGRKIRFFSSKRVADEIELLYRKYHYKQIFIYDDLFSINKPRLKEIIQILNKKRLIGKIKFGIQARANCFDEEMAKLFKILGVISVTFGFETASQKILTYLKGEGITVEDNIRSAKLCKKYNLDFAGYFMVGSPYEDLSDMKETYKFIKNHMNGQFMLYQTTALPGTRVWEYAVKNKIINPEEFLKFKSHRMISSTSCNADPEVLLSKDISGEDFVKMYNQINLLHANDKLKLFKIILKFRFRHLLQVSNIYFLKKALFRLNLI